VLSRLRCVDYTVVSSICKNKVLNIFHISKTIGPSRPECLRVVLSRLRCAYYTDNHSICKNMCFKHFVISQKLLAKLALVSTRCAEQVALRRLHCCLFNMQEWGFKPFIISEKLLGPIDLSVYALCSPGCSAPTTLNITQFAKIWVSNILSYL
jgi:hypothetical protein